MKSKIEYIMFDIGGVLVELMGVPKILRWMNNRVDRNELDRMWLFSPAVRNFEIGRITAEQFAVEMINEFNFSVSPEEFLKEFLYFPSKLKPGASELLLKLSENYSLACLSNTNELHWNRLCCEDCIESLFRYNFPSHKTGYMKPDIEAFRHAIKSMGCNADKILFLDDNQINIDAAKQTGMRAIRVNGFEDVKIKLQELNLITKEVNT